MAIDLSGNWQEKKTKVSHKTSSGMHYNITIIRGGTVCQFFNIVI